ncbi:nitroreductase family protein [Mucilaginibacter sp.]
METTNFTSLTHIIENRRTIKPFMMNGHKIPNGHIASILELADWAPTHGYTEPWRFVVYENPLDFCSAHANLYKENTPADDFSETVFNNLAQQGDKASHVIIAVMKRGKLPKIPAFEEMAATACAVQNLLLGATALNIASYWGTGGMTLKQPMKDYLQLNEEDNIMGILYLGYSDEHPEGKRTIPLEDKITWVK